MTEYLSIGLQQYGEGSNSGVCPERGHPILMQRRKLLAAIGSVAAGGVATVGTGAFSSTAVDRNVTVDVQTDSAAYLGLVPTDQLSSSDPNGQFADEVSSGELEVAFDDSDNGGSGVNQDAVTVFDNVFQIENQGTQPVDVELSDGGGGNTAITVQDPGSIGDGTAPDGGSPTDITSGSDELAVALAAAIGNKDGGSGDDAVTLNAGSAVKVDFAVSTSDDTSFPTLNALTIDAEDADDN